MQIIELDNYNIRESEENEIGIFIPNVNNIEYINTLDKVNLEFSDNILEINYMFNDIVERKIIINGLSTSIRYLIQNAINVSIVEMLEDHTVCYSVTVSLA
jgi:hypothetical protein